MPRFGGPSLFYLSSRGAGDGLWRYQDGESLEVWKGSEGALLEPPAVSADGLRSVIVLRRGGKLRLHVISGDGAEIQPLTEMIDVRGAASWSPDGTWIVTGGIDSRGLGLFKVPVGGGEPTRLVDGPAYNPVWSPDGNVILYSGGNVGPLAPLRAVRPDGTPFDLPAIQLRVEGERYRFLPNGGRRLHAGLAAVTGLLAARPGHEGIAGRSLVSAVAQPCARSTSRRMVNGSCSIACGRTQISFSSIWRDDPRRSWRSFTLFVRSRC